MKIHRLLFAAIAAFASGVTTLQAWDYTGHRYVNQIALAALPPEFPAFVHEPANAERIAFLAGEPDRWRNMPDLPLQQYNGLDHYLDLEQIREAGLEYAKLPSLRYVFATEFAAARQAHLAAFPPIDETKNLDHSREWCGFLPWTITEYYDKLKSEFSYLKTYEDLGTPEEIANAKANIVYTMGVMGHYVGDGAQPLHDTIHHHGWVGDNPHGYTTWPGIHAWIDGGFIAKAGVKLAELTPQVTTAKGIALPAREDGRDPMFVAVMNYLLAQNAEVVPLYQLEKDGKFGHLPAEPVVTPEARAFIDGQLRKGGEMLAAIWVTAWRNAGPDTYLRKTLLLRQGIVPPTPAKKP